MLLYKRRLTVSLCTDVIQNEYIREQIQQGVRHAHAGAQDGCQSDSGFDDRASERTDRCLLSSMNEQSDLHCDA